MKMVLELCWKCAVTRHWVQTEDGFEMEYALSELVSDSSIDDYHVTYEDVERQLMDEKREVVDRALGQKLKHVERMVRGEETWEIDLHIEELIDSHKGMNNTQILEVQMSRLRSFIFQAAARRVKRLILIHGVGEGILRHEVRTYLDGHDNMTYHDAPYKEYGYGATEVLVRYH